MRAMTKTGREQGTGAAGAGCVQISSDGRVLVLAGDLDVRSTFEVRAAVYEHLSLHGEDLKGEIVVDISDVRSVDATALKVLAAASRQAQQQGVRMVVRGACPAVRRMLHLTHLIRVIELDRDPVPA